MVGQAASVVDSQSPPPLELFQLTFALIAGDDFGVVNPSVLGMLFNEQGRLVLEA